MLICLTDIKGKQYWINPIYVRAVVPKKPDLCLVYATFGFTSVIKMQESAEHVAAQISAAMPDAADITAALAQADEDEQRQQAAATAAIG